MNHHWIKLFGTTFCEINLLVIVCNYLLFILRIWSCKPYTQYWWPVQTALYAQRQRDDCRNAVGNDLKCDNNFMVRRECLWENSCALFHIAALLWHQRSHLFTNRWVCFCSFYWLCLRNSIYNSKEKYFHHFSISDSIFVFVFYSDPARYIDALSQCVIDTLFHCFCFYNGSFCAFVCKKQKLLQNYPGFPDIFMLPSKCVP